MRARRHWRASIRDERGWRSVRPASGPYARAALVEWGSITKGLVGTAATMVLPLDREVRQFAPRFPGADFTVQDLIEHTSGLPRLHVGMGLVPFRDPYLPTVGAPLDPDSVVRSGDRGQFAYSNLGYALLGELLDDVDGNWFRTVRKLVLEPAGITTATTAPLETARVVPRRLGRPVEPWRMGGRPMQLQGASGRRSRTSADMRTGLWETWTTRRGRLLGNDGMRRSGSTDRYVLRCCHRVCGWRDGGRTCLGAAALHSGPHRLSRHRTGARRAWRATSMR